MSMFGGFHGPGGYLPTNNLGQGVVTGMPGPGGFGGPGGFPGIFPAGGVSNSGFAGIGVVPPPAPCTPADIKTGRCVMGPPLWAAGH
jgi:hypothetical protein